MSEAELKQALTKHGTFKAQLSRLARLVKDDPNNDEIPMRASRMIELFVEFENTQTSIEYLDNSQTQLEERIEIEDDYYKVMTKIKRLTAPIIASATAASQSPRLISQTPKLPEISLPIFHGCYDKWMQFRDTFVALVHNNAALQDIQKFYYLQSCLKGESAQVMEALQICDSNYAIAWDALVKRYDRPRILINSHLKEINELPSMQRESYATLKSFLDSLNSHLKSLNKLASPANLWEHLIVQIITLKLDIKARRDWESSIQSNNIDTPTIDNILTFLEGKCQVLEGLGEKPVLKGGAKQTFLSNTFKQSCRFCNGPHAIYKCTAFLNLTPYQRADEAKKVKLCLNCLRPGHFLAQCKSQPCTRCNKKHNTLLHAEQTAQQTQSPTSGTSTQESLSAHSNSIYNVTLLSTAFIDILDVNNQPVRCKVLLDSGSQSNFMTRQLFDKLQIRGSRVNITIKGITQSVSNVLSTVKTKIKSTYMDFSEQLEFLVLDKISGSIPQQTFNKGLLKIPSNIYLADPKFNVGSEVDALLGASIFLDLLCVGQIRLGIGQPILQKTKLGWVIAGPLTDTCPKKVNSFLCTKGLEEQLERFWVVENCNSGRRRTVEELDCENGFKESVSREATGHFKVKLPLRENYHELGDSMNHAFKRFKSLENKLNRNPTLKAEYVSFMKEYEDLGHMTQIKLIKSNNLNYYIPHHCVIKEASTTTRVRVVFDASSKTSTGLSLNDVLKVGPSIQNDLFSNVTKFRMHDYVLTGDIEKMYRQVYINEDQRDLQRIIWRNDTNDEIKHYNLNTVTYGTAPASFLATRALKQISLENEKAYPVESKIIADDFYVDDLLTGSNDLNSLRNIKQNLVDILAKYGFNLRKFINNYEQASVESTKQIMTDSLESNKTLGISWDSNRDIFIYSMQCDSPTERVTKRIILSTIAHIFDPLGLLGPVVMQAKILMQELWKLKLDWDESVPMNIHSSFKNFREQLKAASAIKIPRQATIRKWQTIELHGFSDASQVAYGACIYVRSEDECNKINSRLLCAKSRVAPLKVISLPRLELCGALLLAQLMSKVVEALQQFSIKNMFYWSDSTITLAWINTSPNNLKTFVANRVAEIQELTDKNHWQHVASAENPADLISRGLNPTKLVECKLWWGGPKYLHSCKENWPTSRNIQVNEIPETRILASHFVNIVNSDIFKMYSSLSKLQRTVAYCLRFYNNSKKPNIGRVQGNLEIGELDNALVRLLKLAQGQCFSQEITMLAQLKSISGKSKIFPLNPFVDDKGLIRVGGRLGNSNLTFDQRHPIIIPEGHDLTKLIIRSEHLKNLHAGPQLLLSTVRQRYWPINGRNVIKGVLRNCVTCFRAKPIKFYPQMGSLPESRVNPTYAFQTCGIDYAGPFMVKEGTLRNRKLVKAYICLFVCFTTKAVHLELTASLSTDSFLNSLKRFVSRRGLCRHIYSDNGTNFVGANNEFNNLQKLQTDPKISNYFKENSIDWHFIPARSPHFGGLWEAAVKSCKYHLKRILINTKLDFENFYTILTQVEAVLNSRPLLPMTNDPSDLQSLTPGHFLIGRPLNAVAEANVQDIKINRLNRYQHMQKLVQDFWSIWSKEYLHNLQQRTKWRSNVPNHLEVGALILMVKDNTPPLQWPLGRIMELHPGKDDIVRVVSIKTVNGIVRRAVSNVCALPLSD